MINLQQVCAAVCDVLEVRFSSVCYIDFEYDLWHYPWTRTVVLIISQRARQASLVGKNACHDKDAILALVILDVVRIDHLGSLLRACVYVLFYVFGLLRGFSFEVWTRKAQR